MKNPANALPKSETQGFLIRVHCKQIPSNVMVSTMVHPLYLPLKTPRIGEVNLLQTYSPCYPKSYEQLCFLRGKASLPSLRPPTRKMAGLLHFPNHAMGHTSERATPTPNNSLAECMGQKKIQTFYLPPQYQRSLKSRNSGSETTKRTG